jgi:hypothetical protein
MARVLVKLHAVRWVSFLLCIPLVAAPSLDQEIARIAAQSGGTVGVAAVHLDPAGRSGSGPRNDFRWLAFLSCRWH